MMITVTEYSETDALYDASYNGYKVDVNVDNILYLKSLKDGNRAKTRIVFVGDELEVKETRSEIKLLIAKGRKKPKVLESYNK